MSTSNVKGSSAVLCSWDSIALCLLGNINLSARKLESAVPIQIDLRTTPYSLGCVLGKPNHVAFTVQLNFMNTNTLKSVLFPKSNT